MCQQLNEYRPSMSKALPNVEAPMDPPPVDPLGLTWSEWAFSTIQYSVKGLILGAVMVVGVAALLGEGHWPTIGAILIMSTYSNGFVSKL